MKLMVGLYSQDFNQIEKLSGSFPKYKMIKAMDFINNPIHYYFQGNCGIVSFVMQFIIYEAIFSPLI